VRLGKAGDLLHLHEVDEETADGNLGTDVAEDAERAESQPLQADWADRYGQVSVMRTRSKIPCLVELGFARLELDRAEPERKDEQYEGHADIGQAHGRRFGGAIELPRSFGHAVQALRCEGSRSSQDKERAEEGCDEGTHGVEGLCEVEAAGCGARRPDDGDVWIGRNLNGGHAGGENNKGSEENVEAGKRGCWHKSQCACAHDHEAHDHRALVVDEVDKFAARVAKEEVRREEGKLHQHRLRIGELEDALQVRDDDVVEARKKADHEEERNGNGHGTFVGCDDPVSTRFFSVCHGYGLRQ
jgi:hypothetical protein